jgi:hypothetical protein
MNNLINKADIDQGCRQCTAQDELVNRCIEEAQRLDIIPAIGADLWLRLEAELQPDAPTDMAIALLWDGGTYTSQCGETRIFAGLKKTLCYYAYARIVRSSGGVSTRFDFVVKADQYSDSADLQAKVQAYNEAFATADSYKAQALAYLNTSEVCCKRKITNNRLSVKKIGK